VVSGHSGAVLDAGALVAIDRRDRQVGSMLELLRRRATPIRTSGGVVAQVWRDGSRQANLARLLGGVDVVALDATQGRRVGELLGEARTRDVVDGHVALLARSGDLVLTSDPDDLDALLRLRKIDAATVRV